MTEAGMSPLSQFIESAVKNAPEIADRGYWGVTVTAIIALTAVAFVKDRLQAITFGAMMVLIILISVFVIFVTNKANVQAAAAAVDYDNKISVLQKKMKNWQRTLKTGTKFSN
jgi:nitrate/nitrite transporter NarK